MATNQKNPLIRIYGIVPFDRGAKARWLLTELGVAYEDRWLDRESKENEGPAFLKLNPMGRVPVAEVGDQVVFESGAICAVLADQFLEKGLAPALASPQRGDYQKFMYFASTTVDAFQTRIMIIEDIPAGPVRKEKEEALQAELRDALEMLDGVLAKSSYLVGDAFTAADICVTYHLYWLKLWPELESVMKPFGRVLGYLDRMQARPAAEKVGAFSYKG